MPGLQFPFSVLSQIAAERSVVEKKRISWPMFQLRQLPEFIREQFCLAPAIAEDEVALPIESLRKVLSDAGEARLRAGCMLWLVCFVALARLWNVEISLESDAQLLLLVLIFEDLDSLRSLRAQEGSDRSKIANGRGQTEYPRRHTNGNPQAGKQAAEMNSPHAVEKGMQLVNHYKAQRRVHAPQVSVVIDELALQ
jgi:hypothetical protein